MLVRYSLLLLFGLFVVIDTYTIPNTTKWNIISPGNIRSNEGGFYGVEGSVHQDTCNHRIFSVSSTVDSIGKINNQKLSSSSYMTMTTPPYTMEQLYGPYMSEGGTNARINFIGYQECILRSFYHRNFIFTANAVFEGWRNVDLVFRHQQQIVCVLSVRNATLNDYHIHGGGGIIWEFGNNINQDWENLATLFKNREELEMAIIFVTPETIGMTTTAPPTTKAAPITSDKYIQVHEIETSNNSSSIFLDSSSINFIIIGIVIVVVVVMVVLMVKLVILL